MSEQQFEHMGLQCKVVLTLMGHHCGYVAVASDHPWFGKGYDDVVPVPQSVLERAVSGENVGYINLFCATLHVEDFAAGRSPIDLAIDVHGGLTFAAADRTKPLWWFGFDCAHCDDGRSPADPNWKDADFTADQCRKLAEQLAIVPALNDGEAP